MINEKMRRRMLLGAAGAMMSLGLVVTAAPAAQAAPEAYCPSGATCVWEDHYYMTSGHEYAYAWFQQCISDYNLVNYKGTSIKATGPTSVYNNGNYDTTQIWANSYYFGSGPTLSLQYRTLAKKTGDFNVQDNAGYIAGFVEPNSGKFQSVPGTCRT